MSPDSDEDGNNEPDAQPVYPSRGPDREEMVAAYLPKEEEWLAKTVLDLNDPAAVAALGEFGAMFPEVDDLQPIIDEFVQEFLKGRTSIGGEGREEYGDIFKAMYGGNIDDETKRWAAMLGADED